MVFNNSKIKIILTCLVASFAYQDALAEPYLAQRYGQQCSACHTNITGGGKRTEAGLGYAYGLSDSPLASSFTPKIGDAISVGANLRADWTYTKFDEPEESPQGVIGEELEDTSTANISNGTLYFEFAMSDKISLYLDQQVAPEGGRTREAFGLYKGVLGSADYIKMGKFFLPYGLRLQDDEAFIRENTGFNFDNSDIGVEYGAQRGAFAYSVAVTNGTQGAGENNTDKQISSVFSFVQPKYRLGFSLSKNRAPNNNSQELYGVFGGLTLGKWVFLGEVNAMETTSGSDEPVNALVGYASVDFLATNSTNLKLSYDYLDSNEDIDEQERTRVSILGETFFNQYSQFRYGLRRYDGIPQNTFQNQSIVFTEFHIFF